MLEDKNGNSVMATVGAKGIQRTQASMSRGSKRRSRAT